MDVDIVEKNLIKKLNSSEVDKQILPNFSLEDAKKVIGDAEILEGLYYLLTVKAEWLELQKKPPLLQTPAEKELDQRVKQIKNKFNGAATTKVGGSSQQREEIPAWFSTNPEIYRWSSHTVDLEKIHGFEEKGMVMERLLLKENKVACIAGVVGVGKTALCQLAFNRQQVQNYSPLRIWLCFSKQNKPDAAEGSLEKRILSCLGFEDEAIPKELQLQAMRRQLKRGRYLIVLDDVSTTEHLNLISFLTEDQDQYGSDAGGRGGALLVTCRNEYAEKIMNINKHNLLPLVDDHDESCWKIFLDAVEKDGIVKQLPEEMEKLKHKIVRKCEGLPLMAKMLGLIGQDIAKNIDQEIQTQQQ